MAGRVWRDATLRYMTTPAEQKALAFVALVILLGGTFRVVRGGVLASPSPSLAEQQALAGQSEAASRSAAADRQRRGGRSGAASRSGGRRRVRAGFDSTGVLSIDAPVRDASGFPPPGHRIDIGVPGALPGGPPAVPGGRAALIDLDVADATTIERLPRVGPTLAKRIVASRDSLGPFGGLSGLRRVRGMGPVMLERLAPFVTFSAQARR